MGKQQDRTAFPLLPEVHTAEGTLLPGALLLEGGSFRGIFTAGVCDVLMEQGIHMQCVAGVSAGALNAVNVTSRQVGRFASICLLHRNSVRYTGLGAIPENGGLMGFRYLFHGMEKVYPIPAFPAEPERRFVAVATDVRTGEPVYCERGNLKRAAKASSSLVIASRMVRLDGRKLLDGSYSVHFPLEWATREGYEKKIVVLTRPITDRKKPVREKTMNRIRRLYRRYPLLCEAVEHLPDRYAASREALEAQVERGEAFVIQPERPLTLGSMEKDTAKLYEAYCHGRECAEKALPALRAYLGI